jgi:hypothetical protein
MWLSPFWRGPGPSFEKFWIPITGEGLHNLAYARHSGPLSREGSLSCHTYCVTGTRFLRSHPKDRHVQSPLTAHKGMWRIYFNSDPLLKDALHQVRLKLACLLWKKNINTCKYGFPFCGPSRGPWFEQTWIQIYIMSESFHVNMRSSGSVIL